MTNFKKNNSNRRGQLLFSSKSDKKGNSYEVYEYIPTEEELKPYENSDEEPLPFIKELMKYKSKEEKIMATENFMDFINLAERMHGRMENEEGELS